MKTVYFVRHGETEDNAAQRFNSPDTPLSEKGKKQARDIAERCIHLPIEKIITSTMKRAEETAAVISARIGIETESSELFIEGTYTSRFFGKDVFDQEVSKALEMYYKNFSVPEFRYEDGENFNDLKTRALDALAYLEKKPEKNILVVSHTFFAWIIAAAAVFGPRLSADECKGIISGFDRMNNAGLTVLTNGALPRKPVGEPTSPWLLKVWNDHAHLG